MNHEFNKYNHLDFHNLIYLHSDKKISTFSNISEAIRKNPKKYEIDSIAVIELLNRNYILGDRTIIQGVHKSPWMARPDKSGNDWEYYKELPPHRENIINQNDIANTFHTLLQEELEKYLESKKSIGILLSGGMDSRIVAGLLNEYIQKNSNTSSKQIVALTWGLPKCRDVEYASRIAKLYGWEWMRFKVDKEQMEQNVDVCAENGCEYSPIHLHAMPRIRDVKGLDCILAGSFGDSIGRGEYSGRKVIDLKSLKDTNRYQNIGGILRKDFREWAGPAIEQDVDNYHELFPRDQVYQQRELDNQLHYMRRMLNACMSVINEKIPLYQMFTSPTVYGYMWSLHPDLRNDQIYEIILKKYFPELMEIPWARTGLKYPLEKGRPDQYSKRHHNYGEMIRKYFLDQLNEDQVKDQLSQLNIFNIKSIERLIHLCKTYPIPNSYFFEERLLWLLSLAKFVNNHKVRFDLPPVPKHNTFYAVSAYGKRYLKQRIIDNI